MNTHFIFTMGKVPKRGNRGSEARGGIGGQGIGRSGSGSSLFFLKKDITFKNLIKYMGSWFW